jgi:hypothetical protein
MTLSSLTIQGAYGLPSIPKNDNVFSSFLSKTGKISGGYTLGKGMQSLSLTWVFLELILIVRGGKNCESLFLLGKISYFSKAKVSEMTEFLNLQKLI